MSIVSSFLDLMELYCISLDRRISLQSVMSSPYIAKKKYENSKVRNKGNIEKSIALVRQSAALRL
jgi:hypothetical protein